MTGQPIGIIGVFAFDTGFGNGMCHVVIFGEWVETLYFIRVSKALWLIKLLKVSLWRERLQLIKTAPAVLCEAVSTRISEPSTRERK